MVPEAGVTARCASASAASASASSFFFCSTAASAALSFDSGSWPNNFVTVSIISYCLVFPLGAGGTDLGEVVRPQHTDGIDHHGEGDHQLDGRSQELASLEGHTTHDHDGLRDTLATQRGQQGGDDAIHQGGEETGHHGAQVERSSEDDDVLGIEHFVCKVGESFIQPKWIYDCQENGYPPTDKMALIPSDVLRTHVLPFLDYATRLDANSVLDRDSRFVQKVNREEMVKNMAVEETKRLIQSVEQTSVLLNRVKASIRLFRFVQTPIGRILLKHKRFREVLFYKVTHLEIERPLSWWNRSPYRKQLKVEMERVRDMIIAAPINNGN
jgi:hypothetical protein